MSHVDTEGRIYWVYETGGAKGRNVPATIMKHQGSCFGLNRETEGEKVDDEFKEGAWGKDHVGSLY